MLWPSQSSELLEIFSYGAIDKPLTFPAQKRAMNFSVRTTVFIPWSAALLVCLSLCCVAPRTLAAEAPPFSPSPNRPGFALTNPIIVVSPKMLDFGPVPAGKSATNTFLVENMGHGKLVGRASVPSPFKVVSGETYALSETDVQVVTVTFTPGRALTNTATVTFTGGGGTKAKVFGESIPPRD